MKLKVLFLIIGISILNLRVLSQNVSWEHTNKYKQGALKVYYFENKPFAFNNEQAKLDQGIELDILQFFKRWLKLEKDIELEIDFVRHLQFDQFLESFLSGNKDIMGAGSLTRTNEREESYKFSSPYLKNTSVLISDGNVPTVLNSEDFGIHFSGYRPIAIKGSVHEKYLIELIKKHQLNVVPEYVKNTDEFFAKLKESSKYYGYVDIITFWSYVKQNKTHFIKMHKSLNQDGEYFSFIFKPESDWDLPFSEFFESGFGFTSTKEYHRILKNYLGEEVIKYVELD